MRSLRILLVDDHAVVRDGIRALLQSKSDWTVCGEAADGLEAVERARELRPDAVLMDVSMPRMEGWEATRAILRDLPTTKIIIISQNEPEVARQQAEGVSAHGFVSKSELAPLLVPTLERVFNGAGTRDSGAAEGKSGTGSLAWLNVAGEMGELMRATDWRKTPLGAPETWSPALRMMVKFLLANRFPQLLWWGPEHCCLYNDAYVPVLGAKHPWALGRPTAEVWGEIWNVLKPLVETPFHGGPATWMEDIPLEVNRRGFFEETHFTIAYSPVPDETVASGIGGVLATVHEITEKVVGERRVVALRDLGARPVELKSAEEACKMAAEALARHGQDVPFALIYLLERNAEKARLVSASGVDSNDPGCQKEIDVAGGGGAEIWPVAQALAREEIQLVERLQGKFAQVPQGPWSDPPNQAAVVPIRSNIAHQPAGFLVVGISRRLRFDESYRNFLELMSTQIATTIANARAYEEERKRAEALAEIDRAKTTFFSNVSHEFRTPLTLMLGPLEDLLSRSHADLSPAAKEQLEMVNRNGVRLLRLVNTLLDFSRIEAGRVQAVYQPTDMGAFTSELASVFRSATERAGLRLVIECPTLHQPVYLGRDMWEKIVLNLLSNAFKFTFEGEIAVSVSQTEETAELRVRDTGAGIPAAEMPRLFERFHRIENTKSRTHEGSGIGLALVHELVKLHGGTLRAESTPGEGSTFIVSVPLGKEHLPAEQIGRKQNVTSTPVTAAAFVEEALRWLPEEDIPNSDEFPMHRELLAVPAPPVPGESFGERPRVLVADDNSDLRQYLMRLLAEHYEVEAVADGQAALDAARERAPDLILSDVMMPRLDGLGLLRELRADPALNEIPIILLSARAGEESRLEGVQAGADDYLIKPFSARELTARVEAHVKMHRMRRQARMEQRQLTKEYETLLNQAPLGIFEVDAELRLRQVNPVAQPILAGIPNLIGKPLVEIVYVLWGKEAGDQLVRIFRRTLETGEPYETPEWVELRRDRGVQEYYEFRVDRIPLPDGSYGVVCYFRDISAQVRARMALIESEERYRKLAATLEEQVEARTHELQARNADILKQSEEVRNLSARLLQSQDEERRRIARELHDSAGQILAAIAMEHGRIAQRLKAFVPNLPAEMGELEKLTTLLNQEIRTTSYLLHPPTLDASGLGGALRWYVEGLRPRSGLEVELDIAKNFGRLSREMELAVFRIVQEALTNVHRHSGSKKAVIRVSREDARVVVEIRDNGKGMSADKLIEVQSYGSGVGLRGMRERVRQLHGEMRIESDGSGTRILAVFPVMMQREKRETGAMGAGIH